MLAFVPVTFDLYRPLKPRLRWALTGFGAIMLVCGLVALVSRIVGRRQVRRIDSMMDENA